MFGTRRSSMAGPRLLLWGLLLTLGPQPGLSTESGSEATEDGDESSTQKDSKSPNRHFVYGRVDQEVKVYVKINRDSPFLVCMDEKLAHHETIDPFYLWIGPDGRNVKGHSYVNLTDTGKIALKTFAKDMSGAYMCTLSYTSFKNEVLQEKEKFRAFKFIVLAYREPDYTYQITVRYSASQCDVPANDRFFEELKTILDDLIFGLTCQLTDAYYKCHIIKAPKHGLQNEIFITFRLSPFGAGWEAVCRQLNYDCEDETNKRVMKWSAILEHTALTTVPTVRSAQALESATMDQPPANKTMYKTIRGCALVCSEMASLS
ncbi:zona pellucida-binding protein 2 isoform X2 [Ambystoma mexicanum]|uniref:zona pellucida-binding protein 2 isoform X2 n=1 Tax=Ambystoma mexicanum TaxID=8296 RepID=UPI0037E71207